MVATRFYEWRTDGKKRLPIHHRLRDGEPFAFAGVWDRWAGGAEPLFSYALATTTSNDLVRPVRDRTPVVLPPDAFGPWLDPKADPAALLSLLGPYPADGMRAEPANPAPNKPSFAGPDCPTPPTP